MARTISFTFLILGFFIASVGISKTPIHPKDHEIITLIVGNSALKKANVIIKDLDGNQMVQSETNQKGYFYTFLKHQKSQVIEVTVEPRTQSSMTCRAFVCGKTNNGMSVNFGYDIPHKYFKDIAYKTLIQTTDSDDFLSFKYVTVTGLSTLASEFIDNEYLQQWLMNDVNNINTFKTLQLKASAVVIASMTGSPIAAKNLFTYESKKINPQIVTMSWEDILLSTFDGSLTAVRGTSIAMEKVMSDISSLHSPMGFFNNPDAFNSTTHLVNENEGRNKDIMNLFLLSDEFAQVSTSFLYQVAESLKLIDINFLINEINQYHLFLE